jgi:ATP-dependent Clp protease ATP-binding subunit ClpB
VDFKNTLIVMTSNIASQFIQELSEQRAEQWEIEARLKDALKQTFRPEFLNRIDETVVFHSLTKKDLAAIAEIQIADLSRRLADRKISMEVTEAAKALIGELGYDPTFGARPMKRLIQQELENRLATKILSGDVKAGGHVVIDAQGKGFALDVAARPQAEATVVSGSDGQDEPAQQVEGEVVEE